MASKPRRTYALTSAELPILKTLGLEEVDPEDVFELQRKEGAGAFGRVFRACYKQDRNRLAALKVIPVALEAGERGEDIESVRREIEFLRECDHPNVVAFHGAYYKDGALWVAMEHCAGGSVGDIRRLRALSEREISVIMRGALRGLAYLHSRRKIHRDVKGGNILLTASGQVKIADFGVSAQLRDTLSRRGTFVGTPYWMSPELIQDSDYDFKADIWSLGITAIELADQKPPLFDEHPMRVLIQIPRNPPPQVAHPENWSAAFLSFLRFCLRKDPAERPSALECMQHEFIRREEHVEKVFASGEEEGGAVEVSPKTKKADESKPSEVGKAALPPANVAVDANLSTVEQELEDEIAEEIGECVAAGDRASRSESSYSSKSDDDDGEISTGLLGETFEFRDGPPLVSSPSPSSSAGLTASRLNISESVDELRDLSVDSSLGLEKAPAAPGRANHKLTLSGVGDQSHIKLQQQSVSNPASYRQPPTEFKLLPASAKSPIVRGSTNKDSTARFTSTRSSDKLGSFKKPPKPSASPVVSPRPASSVRSSWLSVSSQQDDPLASIDTVTSARVSKLLSSFSASTSSPSLAAAMRAYNDQYAGEIPSRTSTRQSFNWRSVEATMPSANPAPSTSSRDDVNGKNSIGKIFIGDPFRASHDVCVKYNSIQAQYEGAPMSAEWAALHQQFGLELSHMRCRAPSTQGARDEDQVPALLRMLRRELMRRGGLQSKYVYRVSPVQEEVQQAKAAINRGSFEPAQISDPHVFASLLKLWLRELPTLLLDELDEQDLSSIAKFANPAMSTRLTDDDDGLQLVTSGNIDAVDRQVVLTLRKLGTRQNAVFQWLLEHMLEVNSYRSSNQMSAQALATVMAPNLFSCIGTASTSQTSAANLMRDLVTFLRVLLSWRRANLGSSPAAATFLLEQEEKDVAPVFPANVETQPGNAKVSVLQERVRQSISKFSKNTEAGPESDQDGLESASLETLLRNRIDGLWTDVEASEVATVETKRQEHILRRIFSDFQQSVLELIAQYSKRPEECTWANDVINDLKSATQPDMTIPPSLGRLRGWVGAALRFEEFCQLLDREQTTQEKMDRLQARFGGASPVRTRGAGNQNDSAMSDHDFAESFFLHLSRIHHQQSDAEPRMDGKNTNTARSNQNEEKGASPPDKLLLDGASRFASLAPSTDKHHGDAQMSSRSNRNVVKMGEHQPAIGNLLALVGDNCQNRLEAETASLHWLQQQLIASAQSSAALYHDKQ